MESKGCVEIFPETPPKGCVIWLHGLGANGHDFESIVPFLKIEPSLSIWYIFPHAPSIPVTINNNFVMPAWYDIYALDRDAKIDENGIRESASRIKTLINDAEDKGVPTEKIIIAGFSQGGEISSHVMSVSASNVQDIHLFGGATFRFHTTDGPWVG